MWALELEELDVLGTFAFAVGADEAKLIACFTLRHGKEDRALARKYLDAMIAAHTDAREPCAVGVVQRGDRSALFPALSPRDVVRANERAQRREGEAEHQ
jgi:hypothetical protein